VNNPKLAPNNGKADFSHMERLRGEYDYPDDLDLHPDSEQHKVLLDHIMDAARDSYEVISERFDTWKELDEKLTVYVDLDAEEQEIKDEDKSKPVSIVVPISYATRETVLTYWVSAFMKHPLFRYRPSKDPKDTIGTIMLESLIAQDCVKSKVGLDLHTMWSDMITYGFGAGSPGWETEMGFKTRYKEEVDDNLGLVARRRLVSEREEIVKFDGNRLRAIDPYNFLPDPKIPVTDPKSMGHSGYSERLTYNQLLMEEKEAAGELFNVKYLAGLENCTSTYFSADDSNTGRYSKTGITYENMTVSNSSKTVDVINKWMWIIPADFGLSDYEYPEHWAFQVAADRVIIKAERSGLDHNTHPTCTMAPDSDGHTIIPVSLLEREYPIQHSIDWLWKSHVANVRKAVNNMFVADPSMINMKDLTDTKFGMVARLRPSAWGRSVKDVLQQLPVQDVTRNHVQDIQYLLNIDARVFTSDQAKGYQERTGERVSAEEARGTRMSYLSKMEKMARIGSMQGHYDIAEQMAYNTLQMSTEEKIVRVLGDYQDVLAREFGITADFAKVDLRKLDPSVDVVPQDGSLPSGEFAPTWERLINMGMQNPETLKTLDFTRMFMHVARLLGVDNPEDFKKKNLSTGVKSDEEIDKGVQNGNLVNATQLAQSRNLGEV